MRVAIFTDNDFDKVNGVTTTLEAVLRHAPPDLQPRVYTMSGLPVDSPDYLALPSFGMDIPFYRGMKMYWPRFRSFVRHATTENVVLIHYTTPGPMGLAGQYTAWKLRLPMVGSFHTDLAAYTALLSGSARLGQLMAAYMRWPYGRCRRVLVPSEATRALLMGSGTAPERLVVWRRGVDTALFDPGRRRRDLRDQWRARDRPVLLYVGRVSREKGLALLPELQASIYGRGISHRLVIVGDGPYRRELGRLCPDAVFTGTLGRQDVADAYASADLFVFPSTTDTAGNVVLEAQASGLPAVVADAGGPREQMVPGVTGLVTDGSVRQLGEAVAVLARDTTVRRQMSAAARAFACTRRWSDALAPLYETWREVAREHAFSIGAACPLPTVREAR